jgi:hypothetical protein
MAERCGLRFRKSVQSITDRAKRYRAHSPGCRPLGPKLCFKCGSRRNVVPDHKDGDESNGKRSNLRWACKSHNTILGKAMAKAGKGVRTRQYNPTERPLSQMTLAEIKKEILTASSKRLAEIKQFARWRGKHKAWFAKNPGATNLAQYVQAAVDHTRGSHDAGGKVIHETPKSKRREFAREIAFRKRHNPKNPGEADALYKKFHGRGPDKILTTQRKGVDPYGGHPELTSLGPLIRLVVGEGVEMNEDGTVKAEGEWVSEINFVPMPEYRRRIERLNTKDQDQVREFKAWLKTAGAPDVAAVPDTPQLYLVGGKQDLGDAEIRTMGAEPKDLVDLGFVYLIEYCAQKRFDRFEVTTYFHSFGEKSGVQPRLIFRKHPPMLELVGGEYQVKSVGIDN